MMAIDCFISFAMTCIALKPCVPPAPSLYGNSKDTNPNPLSALCSLPLNLRGRAGEGVFKDNYPFSIKNITP